MRLGGPSPLPEDTPRKKDRAALPRERDRHRRGNTPEGENGDAARRKRRKTVCGEGVPTPSKTRLYWNAVFEETAESQYFISSRRVRQLVEELLLRTPGAPASSAESQNLLEALVSLSVFGDAKQPHALAAGGPFVPRRARTASLVELMCGGRGNQISFLSPLSPLFRAYVGIDVSDRALSLSRSASSPASSSSPSSPSSPSSSSSPPSSSFRCPSLCSSAASSAAGLSRTEALEKANKCRFLLQDCASLGDDLPLLKTAFALLIAGLDDLLVRNSSDFGEEAEGAEEVDAVLASAGAVLCVGGRLLVLEPTRHLPDLLLAVTKALLSPSGAARFLQLARVAVADSVVAFLFRRESAAFAGERSIEALRAFYARHIRPLAALPALGLDASRLDVDDLRTRLPLVQHLARIQATAELSFLLLQHGGDPSLVNEDGLRAEDILANAARQRLLEQQASRPLRPAGDPNGGTTREGKLRNSRQGSARDARRLETAAQANRDAPAETAAGEAGEKREAGAREGNSGRETVGRGVARYASAARRGTGKSTGGDAADFGWTRSLIPSSDEETERPSARPSWRERCGGPQEDDGSFVLPPDVARLTGKSDDVRERDLRNVALLSWLGAAVAREDRKIAGDDAKHEASETLEEEEETGDFLELLAAEFNGPLVWPFVNPIEVIDACHRRFPPLEGLYGARPR
ncbi:putative ankyrin repeat-containing protein [Neospora caninum Liverpool]|uniref:Putative ankyrin repeat-containing protein n=1 Tax=Neospora caninum (strain Liverpool) TaxID=572307 RepID=F0VA04_NEOCL|nr:putative ankyrin repeat-containing protein [Neospora caninum Liverpool]CBZ50493.1 putative ankyrin repeat-containing protein [Neospora caninum Liverpool]|eukprot:XP_003880526.1 putative ankyrin repeat-containing protein [Neospora caninum Liverpool]